MAKKKCFIITLTLLILSLSLVACSNHTKSISEDIKDSVEGTGTTASTQASEATQTPEIAQTPQTTKEEDYSIMEFRNISLSKNRRPFNNYTNPLITQHYGADPYAIEYDGRLYIYMTADAYEYDAAGEIKENSYGSIKTLYVISTDDMINFTDHGEIKVAGPDGAAKWAHNSWAPAACWKNIDGKDKFFLYFADNGGGIGVLTADSPVGPFTDPLGHGLITRQVPTCAEVTWLFDPAVLIDDDGQGYIYFGGGIPEGRVPNPGTARVCKLGADLISLDGDPVVIDSPYHFEDSGIHKFGNKYYYSYCTNWQVDAEGTAKYGFTNADIVTMVSDNPMGPFTYKEVILKNPGTKFKLYGNNHHCVFNYLGKWYITYHALTLQQSLKVEKGYRSTHIDCVDIAPDGTIGKIEMTYDGRTQLKNVDAYALNKAVTCALMNGGECAPADDIARACGSGEMFVDKWNTGDYIKISGVDFGDTPATKITLSAASTAADTEIYFSVDNINTHIGGIAPTAVGSEEFREFTANLVTPTSGVHDVYIICANGADVQLKSWKFER